MTPLPANPEQPAASARHSIGRRRDIAGDYPLSFAQQRLWFLNHLEPGAAYNQPKMSRLRGPLDVAALKRALDTVVARHEALRTTFHAVEGFPVQRVGPAAPIELPLIDLSGLERKRQEAELRRRAQEIAERPFDLSRDLMLRAALLRLGPADHALLLVTHHIASDGWSAKVLFRELGLLYGAFCRSLPSPLADLPAQYVDFALWQRERLQGDPLESHLAYWKRHLGGQLARLQLPADHPPPAVRSHRGQSASLKLPAALRQGLDRLTHESRVTLFMALLAAFKALLYRYSAQEDVAVGIPIANRRHVEIEKLIGFFVNTLVLRTSLEGNPTFRELLARVRKVSLAGYEHQDLPFEKLVEELNPDRSLGGSPLFQVMFTLQNGPRPSLELPGLEATPVEIECVTAKFDLTLSLAEDEDSLTASFEYDTELFEQITILRMLGHFRAILEGVVIDPDRRLSDLPLLNDAERRRLSIEWNDTRRDHSSGHSAVGLFEAQVERAPDGVALVFPSAPVRTGPSTTELKTDASAESGRGEDRQITYRELNAQANRLAHYLEERGVGPDVPVAICMERSIETIVGLLGILKAGGVYVPLEPDYPKERSAYILRDIRAPVVLTQKRLVDDRRSKTENGDSLSSNPVLSQVEGLDPRLQVICLDSDWEKIASKNADNPAGPVTGDNLAYIIYTSGSTGRPKGAMITHGGLRNRLLWGESAYRLTPADSLLQSFSFSFDFFIWDVLTALSAGARLVLAQPEAHLDSAYLVQFIADQNITVVGTTPSMLEVLLGEAGIEKCRSLKKVVCGGEALPVELQERFFALLDAELQNSYGPTEASIDVANWICRPAKDQRIVPIGRPIANVKIYILDRHLQIVPVGVPGELHIAGIALARGYLNGPDLTAARFLPNPFVKEPGARLYKSGDVARYLPDGNIEFIGRIDDQVKIRGFRVELGEVEAALRRHTAVREATVIAREETAGRKGLLAYVVATQGLFPSASDLRAFLKHTLPDYMIPTAFVMLDALPLTPNGKVDRSALPLPERSNPEQKIGFVAPATQTETAVAQIWAQVLKVDTIGIYDSFFDLGGHSLLATQIVSRVREALSVELPLRALFETPILGELAALIDKFRNGGIENAGAKVSTAPTGVPVQQLRSKGRKLNERF